MLPITRLLSCVLAQGQVHVVDAAAGPGADFTTIHEAVTAAAAGDLVLVRSGNYQLSPADGGLDSVSALEKPLVVLAEQGADVRANDLVIARLPLGDWALVQGLRFEQQGITGQLVDNRGVVWLEGCTFRALQFVNDHEALRVSASDSVLVTRCAVETASPEVGIQASASRLELFQSLVTGGVAMDVASSTLRLSGTEVRGLDGRDGFILLPNGGDGGDGLVLRNASEAWSLDSVLAGGSGGAPLGGGQPGVDGEALVLAPDSTLHELKGSSKALELSSPVREGATLSAIVRGKPGDRVWLRWTTNPSLLVTRLVGPRQAWFLARIPPGGVLVQTMIAPDLPAGLEGMAFFAQAIVRDVETHAFVASSPSATVVLDRGL